MGINLSFSSETGWDILIIFCNWCQTMGHLEKFAIFISPKLRSYKEIDELQKTVKVGVHCLILHSRYYEFFFSFRMR